MMYLNTAWVSLPAEQPRDVEPRNTPEHAVENFPQQVEVENQVNNDVSHQEQEHVIQPEVQASIPQR